MRAQAWVLSLSMVSGLLLKDPVAEPYFDIVFSDDRVASKEAHAKLHDPVQQEYKYRLIHDGREKYLCSVPNITKAPGQRFSDQRLLDGDERAAVQAKEAETAKAAAQRGWDILEKLDGNCIYRGAGWWTYKFCFGKHIEQFHAKPPAVGYPFYPPIPDADHASYSLGSRPNPESRAQSLKLARVQGAAKALSITYDGGTYCPLVRGPRKTEVRFQCCHSDSEHIASIKEVSSCEYLIVVHTSRLCHDIAFMEEAAKPNKEIICSLISDKPATIEGDKRAKKPAKDQLQDHPSPELDTAKNAPIPDAAKPVAMDDKHVSGPEVKAHNAADTPVPVEPVAPIPEAAPVIDTTEAEAQATPEPVLGAPAGDEPDEVAKPSAEASTEAFVNAVLDRLGALFEEDAQIAAGAVPGEPGFPIRDHPGDGAGAGAPLQIPMGGEQNVP